MMRREGRLMRKEGTMRDEGVASSPAGNGAVGAEAVSPESHRTVRAARAGQSCRSVWSGRSLWSCPSAWSGRSGPSGWIAAGLVMLSTLVTSADAHEFWLHASQTEPDSDRLTVSAFVGEGLKGEPVRYSDFLADRLAIVGTEAVDLRPRAGHGKWQFAELGPAESGWVLYESRFSEHEMQRDDFVEYLHTDGLEAILPDVDDTGKRVRERYRRSAKLWTGGPSERTTELGEQIVTEPAGLAMEIVPAKDPVETTGEVTFRVDYLGRPLAGCLVRAWSAEDASTVKSPSDRPQLAEVPIWRGRTNEHGEIVLPLDRRGEWMIAAVHIVPSESSDHDWDSTWSSLSFLR